MPSNFRQIYDLDGEDLADELEALAEAIRDQEVGVMGVESTDAVETDTMAKRTAQITFAFGPEYDDLLRPSFVDPREDSND